MVFRNVLLFVQIRFFIRYAPLLPGNQAVGGGGSRQTQTTTMETAFMTCTTHATQGPTLELEGTGTVPSN